MQLKSDGAEETAWVGGVSSMTGLYVTTEKKVR